MSPTEKGTVVVNQSSKPLNEGSDNRRVNTGLRPAVIICGPTASGKSEAAVKVAEAFDGVVINADSMQIYQELKYLTARPDDAALAAVPHRLYGTLSVSQACSVGHWLELARQEAARAWDDDQLPVFCGGTGLYLKALVQGIAEVPDIPDSVRKDAEKHLTKVGNETFHQDLLLLDPDAGNIRPSDRQRMVRAWCVKHHTGRSLTEWQKERTEGISNARFLVVQLLPDRSWLYTKSDQRFIAMIEAGAIEEAQSLLIKDMDPVLPGMKAVGLREIAAFLGGRINKDEMIASGQQATRRYAKRQYTWFRNQTLDGPVTTLEFSEQYSERLWQKIFSNIRQFLLTTSG